MSVDARGHLSEADLLDLVVGDAEASVEAHRAACADCARRAQDARDGLDLARLAAAPEPAVDWAAFRAEVKGRIGAAERRRGLLVPAMAAAAALVAGLSLFAPHAHRVRQPVATLSPWTPLPPLEGDSSLWVVEDAFAGADDLSGLTGCRAMGDCLASLTDDETAVLTDLLRKGSR
jgi:hypothetical protein